MKEELLHQLYQMEKVAQAFYLDAVHVTPQCHAFIEHAGLLNEFIKICRHTADQPNGDFNNANQHGGEPLLAHGFNIEYLAEKLACIYGPTLVSDEEKLKLFITKFTGVSEAKLKELRGK